MGFFARGRGMLLCLIAAAVALFPAAAAWAASVGTIIGMSGACSIDRGGNSVTLKMGQAVELGDAILVSSDGKLKLRMNDGSILSIAGGTRLALAEYDVDGAGQRRRARLDLVTGLLRM